MRMYQTGKRTLQLIHTRFSRRTRLLLCALAMASGMNGCASIRVTDPPRSATELYLENVASQMAVDQLTLNVLRDRKVYIETWYLTASTQPADEQQYLLGELRSKLLLSGVRLVNHREDAQIIMEVRSQGVSVDRIEYLLGLPATTLGGLFTGGTIVQAPELSILKSTKQHGFASIGYVAYWNDTGEVVASNSPVVGRTMREDFWILGLGPRTTGNIPPAQPALESSGDDKKPPPVTQPTEQQKPPPKNWGK